MNIVLDIYNLVLVILGRVNENVYANHNLCWMLSKCSESKISTRSGMSSSLVIIIISGRSVKISLKSISSLLSTAASCGVDCGPS